MKIGGHEFPKAPHLTSSCVYGCGAWMGPSRSSNPQTGGQIDAWGPCPNAPDPTYVRPREETDAEIADRLRCGKTSCALPKPHNAHRCDHGVYGPCLACEDWAIHATEPRPWTPARADLFESGAKRGERHRAWILASVAWFLRRAADRLDGGS